MSEFIETRIVNHVGLITLNRPKALNALSPDMIRALMAALTQWAEDPEVYAVVVRGAGEKGFCAGGDIRYFYETAQRERAALLPYFVDEYALDYLIATYPKPYIALLDGIVMGGGMGISQGAALRIVTETTRMAMPETQIGLFPDVGGGYFLAQLPGRIGEYLGTTGVAIGAADALYAGLADVYLPRNMTADLLSLLETESWRDGNAVVARMRALADGHVAPPPRDTALKDLRDAIDMHFSRESVPAILASLSCEGRCEFSEWAQHIEGQLRKRSPLMVCVTLEQIRRARLKSLSLADELRVELSMMKRVFDGHDGLEGIRALAIDKDHAPRWLPASLDQVDAMQVERFFESEWPARAHPLAHLGS